MEAQALNQEALEMLHMGGIFILCVAYVIRLFEPFLLCFFNLGHVYVIRPMTKGILGRVLCFFFSD